MKKLIILAAVVLAAGATGDSDIRLSCLTRAVNNAPHNGNGYLFFAVFKAIFHTVYKPD